MKKSFLGFKSVGHLARFAFIAASVWGAMSATTLESQAQAKLLRVRGTLQHVHGANIGWVVNSGGSNYGHDLGPNNFTGYGYNYVGADMDSYFGDIKNMHTNVVRVWLFENLEGLNFDGSGYISGINSTFLANVNDMITRAYNKGIALELVLFNHDIGNQFGKVPRVGGGVAVKNFFADSGAQTAMINNVIKPLATAEPAKQGVFGFDLLNEANYTVSPYSGITASSTWSQIHSYIYNAANAIHAIDGAAQVTCSTDNADSFSSTNFYNRFGGVGLNYYEYHTYTDSPNLWTIGSAGAYPSIDKPIILGEYGPSTTGNTALQTTVTDTFINQEQARGWAGSLAWKYDATGADSYTIVTGIGAWKDPAWKIQYWGLNRFGL